ncbi:hypothetical protein ACLKA6_005874 [Drosophila palustris]
MKRMLYWLNGADEEEAEEEEEEQKDSMWASLWPPEDSKVGNSCSRLFRLIGGNAPSTLSLLSDHVPHENQAKSC